MQLELFFKVGYVCTIEEQGCTQFAVLIQCHDSTGCDEMGDYFAIEADTMKKVNKQCLLDTPAQ